MTGSRPESGTTSTRRRWLLPILSLVSSGLSYLAFGEYAYWHAILIHPDAPNDMWWVAGSSHTVSELFALAALVLAVATVIKGRRWQRVAGMVAMLPALVVCDMSQVTF